MDSKSRLPSILFFGYLICPLCSHFSQCSKITFSGVCLLNSIIWWFSPAYCLLSHSPTEVPALVVHKEATESWSWDGERWEFSQYLIVKCSRCLGLSLCREGQVVLGRCLQLAKLLQSFQGLISRWSQICFFASGWAGVKLESPTADSHLFRTSAVQKTAVLVVLQGDCMLLALCSHVGRLLIKNKHAKTYF